MDEAYIRGLMDDIEKYGYAQGFLKAIDVVREFSLATLREQAEVPLYRLLTTTRLENKIEGIRETQRYLTDYFTKEIKNGIRN